MTRFALTLVSLFGLVAGDAFAWSNHTFSAYRTFERMKEVADAAPVSAEPLDAFAAAVQKRLSISAKKSTPNVSVSVPMSPFAFATAGAFFNPPLAYFHLSWAKCLPPSGHVCLHSGLIWFVCVCILIFWGGGEQVRWPPRPWRLLQNTTCRQRSCTR